MEDDQLSVTFAALADPTRRALLSRLAAGGDATVNELAEPFAMSLQAISKHLKVLESAGLITRGRSAQSRPCRIATTPIVDAMTWLDRHRMAGEARFDRLGEHLRERQQHTADSTTD